MERQLWPETVIPGFQLCFLLAAYLAVHVRQAVFTFPAMGRSDIWAYCPNESTICDCRRFVARQLYKLCMGETCAGNNFQ